MQTRITRPEKFTQLSVQDLRDRVNDTFLKLKFAFWITLVSVLIGLTAIRLDILFGFTVTQLGRTVLIKVSPTGTQACIITLVTTLFAGLLGLICFIIYLVTLRNTRKSLSKLQQTLNSGAKKKFL